MARYTKGSRGYFISDRSGFRYPNSEKVKEPGTGYIVARSESDGMWSIALHPQNFSPPLHAETIGVKDPRIDTGAYRESYLIDEVGPGLAITTEDGAIILIEG